MSYELESTTMLKCLTMKECNFVILLVTKEGEGGASCFQD